MIVLLLVVAAATVAAQETKLEWVAPCMSSIFQFCPSALDKGSRWRCLNGNIFVINENCYQALKARAAQEEAVLAAAAATPAQNPYTLSEREAEADITFSDDLTPPEPDSNATNATNAIQNATPPTSKVSPTVRRPTVHPTAVTSKVTPSAAKVTPKAPTMSPTKPKVSSKLPLTPTTSLSQSPQKEPERVPAVATPQITPEPEKLDPLVESEPEVEPKPPPKPTPKVSPEPSPRPTTSPQSELERAPSAAIEISTPSAALGPIEISTELVPGLEAETEPQPESHQEKAAAEAGFASAGHGAAFWAFHNVSAVFGAVILSVMSMAAIVSGACLVKHRHEHALQSRGR